MNTRITIYFVALAVIGVFSNPGVTRAALITVSGTAPIDDGVDDIAQLSDSGLAPFSISGYTPVGDGSGDAGDVWGNRGAHGQTFTTLGNPGGYSLDSFSIKSHTNGGDEANAGDQQYTFRIGTISGTTFTSLASGTAIPGGSYTFGDWFTMTFTSPVTLSANTEYAIDIIHDNTPSFWGWRTAGQVDTSYTGGSAYVSGFNGGTVPDDSNIAFPTIDRVFHANLTAIPEPSTFLLSALGLLSLGVFGRRRRCR